MNEKSVQLTDNELQTLLLILNYTLEYCPFESISDSVEINQDSIEQIIIKLKNA